MLRRLKPTDVTPLRDEVGMPESHAACFKSVAQKTQTVILSRLTGRTCWMPLAQGYDTKGFRIHGKSCDWGPMAGFVLRDPRLNKRGLVKEAYNRKEHHLALHDRPAPGSPGVVGHVGSGWKASVTPLKLFPERVSWLQHYFGEDHMVGDFRWRASLEPTPEGFRGEAVHHSAKGDIHLAYVLKRENRSNQAVYGVYIDNRACGFRQEGGRVGSNNGLEPLLAMTNPKQHRSWPDTDFRNAVTGDYDLCAIWARIPANPDAPRDFEYQHNGLDKRILGTTRGWRDRLHYENELEPHFTRSGGRWQATKLGNITERIYEVAQYLNSEIAQVKNRVDGGPRKFGPFAKRMVCWHSDESARPFVNDVDLPLVAFTPGHSPFAWIIEDIQDFRQFIGIAGKRHVTTLSDGWVNGPHHERQEPTKRLPREYIRLVPDWGLGPGGRPQAMNIPSWFNR